MPFTESVPGTIVPAGGDGAGSDICPSGWTEDFDRGSMTTEVLIGRRMPANIPALRYSFPGSVPPAAGQVAFNGPQATATVLYLSKTDVGGGDVAAWLRYINLNATIRVADADDLGTAMGYGVSGWPTEATDHFEVPIFWSDGQTAVPAGDVLVTFIPRPETPALFFDPFGRATYGRETFSLTDLIRTESVANPDNVDADGVYTLLADRILEVRGSNSVPRVDTVTIDARRGHGIQNMELMSTARPERPSRYLLRLAIGERPIFNRMMFVTSVRHFITRDEWTLQISLDVAEWAAQL